jgi:hypothetical protein
MFRNQDHRPGFTVPTGFDRYRASHQQSDCFVSFRDNCFAPWKIFPGGR